MITVRAATFIPESGGGDMHAVLMLGNQQVTATVPLGLEDLDLQALVDRLSVRVRQVTITSTAAGGEIRALMSVGERSFVSRLAIAAGDHDLTSDVNLLLDAVGRRFRQQLQAGLQDAESSGGQERGARNFVMGETQSRSAGGSGRPPYSDGEAVHSVGQIRKDGE